MVGAMRFEFWLVALCAALVMAGSAHADDETAAARGYRLLRSKPYLPADFDQETFENLWKSWPQPLKEKAGKATPAERRQMAFSRYGLMADPDRPDDVGPGLAYVADGKGGWAMSCLACHGGKVEGKVIPGLPNSHYALETLTEDVRATKIMLGKKLTHMDLAQLGMPLGTTVGTTNSVIFGVALGSIRNSDMSVDRKKPVPKLVHHDVDAPPFWNVRHKSMLYCDGFAPKNHRVIMQFILIPQNGKATVEAWENDFRDILAWIESVQPPKYPHDIDAPLAKRGAVVFNDHCARCHGPHGPEAKYPQTNIALEEVGTDPLRLKALQQPHREWMKASWMTGFGSDTTVVAPKGYDAPPLYGIWATAPYFHNGSVPTLWHVLHPDARPKVWTRSDENGYDRERIGLTIESLDDVPESATLPGDLRRYFDTTRPGKSAAGHLFPNELNEDEKRAVLEFLKTL